MNPQSDLYQRLAAKAGFVLEPADYERRLHWALDPDLEAVPHPRLTSVFIAACARRIAERELTTTRDAVNALADPQYNPPEQVIAAAQQVWAEIWQTWESPCCALSSRNCARNFNRPARRQAHLFPYRTTLAKA